MENFHFLEFSNHLFVAMVQFTAALSIDTKYFGGSKPPPYLSKKIVGNDLRVVPNCLFPIQKGGGNLPPEKGYGGSKPPPYIGAKIILHFATKKERRTPLLFVG